MIMEKNNKKIVFDLPEEAVLGDIFDEILKNNNLEETTEDFFASIKNNQDPRVLILIDAAKIIFQKKIPEEKIIELLQKHLDVSKEAAEKIVVDIKQKITPYVKEVSIDNIDNKSIKEISAQEFILEKIKKNMPNQQPSYSQISETEKVKKVEIKNVEENAKNLKKSDLRDEVKTQQISKEENSNKNTIEQPKDNKKDVYREPIE